MSGKPYKQKMLMKKIMLFACAALLFAGCAKENIITSDGNDNQKGDITLSFTASQTGFGTKAVIGDTTIDGESHKSTAINWQSTDKISVFDGDNKNCEFSTKDFSTEAASCTFEGNVTEPATDYTAVYPYTEAATINKTGVISGITLPATQTAVEGSFDTKAALMAAKTVDGGRDLDFKNLVGYVKVATDFNCTKIELCAASGEALAGEGSITFDAEGNPSFAINDEGAVSSITLEGTITAGKIYYIAVPAQTLAAGWSLSFTSTDEKVYKRKASKPIVFKKNTVINLGTIKQEDFLLYVTFSAESEQTFTMNFHPSVAAAFSFVEGKDEYFEYRVGYGKWQNFTTTVSGIEFGGSLGDLQLRGISSQGTAVRENTQYTIIRFGSNVPVSCSGDIRTLVDYTNYETAETSNARFCNLFYDCSQLTSAPDLPATTLATKCYFNMFHGCTSLKAAPALPATELAESCYASMFYYCKALTTAPALEATTLAESCYSGMFGYCEKLTTAPALPATTLAEFCYSEMFGHCTAMETAPALPATTLAPYCYQGMFSGCTSLTETPVLPDAKLADRCYIEMFSGCGSFNKVSIKTKPSLETEDEKLEYPLYFENWLSGCYSYNFYCTQELYDFNKTNTSLKM
ncbi:MAG: fimbrillin family protein [Candidatus Cryptobacteroides sp.]